MDIYGRRTFLKCAGIAAVGIGIADCATKAKSASRNIRVNIQAPKSPLVTRTFSILKSRIEQRCPVQVVESRTRPEIVLAINDTLPPETFCIDNVEGAVHISGGSPAGLLYGVGKFLRTCQYGDKFIVSSWHGTSQPNGSLRGMYFATHFHNYYHQAPEAEVTRYMEDLMLWGVNTIMVILPMINLQGWDDPEAEPAMAMVRRYAKAAKELGLKFATTANNTLFAGAPKEIRATPLPDPTRRRGNSGFPICPSNPEGHAYIMTNTRMFFERLSDIGVDILCFWPYDEGGCACEKCQPWGSNGYLKLSRDLAALGREYFPNLQTVLSTWMFDTPPEGEWQGLSDTLAHQNDWLNYILADAHEDFPRYPLEVGVPGNLPLLNFPEISMWGNSPWGGFGANPLPCRFQRLWDQVKQAVQGGFPYSEGIFEDINKAVVVQFYWDRNQSARATLEEYIQYEFGQGVTEDVLTIINILEASASCSYRKQPVNIDEIKRAHQLAEAVHAHLPCWVQQNWRWEIVRLRALLDKERFVGKGLTTPAAEAAMVRLIEIYHCQMETDDPYHHRVRPPLKRAISRHGEC